MSENEQVIENNATVVDLPVEKTARIKKFKSNAKKVAAASAVVVLGAVLVNRKMSKSSSTENETTGEFETTVQTDNS